MVKINRKVHLSILTAVVASALTALTLHGVGADPGAKQLIATVNLATVFSSEWTRFQEQSGALDREQSSYKNIIEDIIGQGGDASVPPVDTDTLTKWIALREKSELNPAAASADDHKQLSTYKQQGIDATTQLNNLINKGDKLTDAEKKDYDRLQALRQGAEDTVKKKGEEYTAKLQDEAGKARASLDIMVQTSIKQVAEDQGITYILNSPPVGQPGLNSPPVVLYSADVKMDVTESVITKLNHMK